MIDSVMIQQAQFQTDAYMYLNKKYMMAALEKYILINYNPFIQLPKWENMSEDNQFNERHFYSNELLEAISESHLPYEYKSIIIELLDKWIENNTRVGWLRAEHGEYGMTSFKILYYDMLKAIDQLDMEMLS
jgi:hypothetical protein